MRSPIHTLPALVIMVLALLGSCGQPADCPPLLVQADSAIIHADYQQADCLLALYDATQGDASQHTCMYRQFLRMERKFVDDSQTENDYALIDSLGRYYASKGDKEKESVTSDWVSSMSTRIRRACQAATSFMPPSASACNLQLLRQD